MQYNNLYVVYFSPTHTSCKIAEAIAEGYGTRDFTEIDLTYEAPSKPIIIENSLVILAVPVYGGRVAETAVERLQQIRGVNSAAIAVVVYGNRDYEDALIELRDLATIAGFTVISGGAFIGEHSYSRKDRPIARNRPDRQDIELAGKLGCMTRKESEQYTQLNDIPILPVKGNTPYKVKGTKTPQTPVTVDESCTQCEYCIEICPTQSIELKDEIISNADTCIKCCACVKECPNEARIFDTPFTDHLFKNFSTRREPELFCR